MKRPNILVIISHDLGCHIGPYGQAMARCHNLNRLADESMRFDSHFVTSPGCSQSRSSLVTGRYPHANGQFGLANCGWKLNDDELLLPSVLRQAGYHSALIGIWHLHAWTLSAFNTVSHDVSVLDRSPEGFTEVAAPRAADWLKNYKSESQPFYLHVGLWEAHRPFCGNEVHQQEAARIEDAEIDVPNYLPDNTPTRREFAELHQSISVIDKGVGQILDALEESGLANDTIVLFTADHGLPFPRAKGTLYDPGIQVALLARWPGVIPARSQHAGLTSNVDVMPTLLELAEAPIPERVQGRSFSNALRSGAGAGAVRDTVFAEKTYHEHYDPIRCARSQTHKYIRNFAERPMLVLPSDIYNSPTRVSMTEDESIWSSRPDEELYDLAADPLEENNLASDAAQLETMSKYRNALEAWMTETGDPLLNGPIPRQTT